MKLLLALLLLATTATAQTCPNRVRLKAMPSTSRGGTIIYKSNWNVNQNREASIEEGNHAQKGAALLIQYKAAKYMPTARTIEVRDLNCKVVAYMGRYPRCTSAGCGEHERWYLRAPGGSYLTVAGLANKISGVSVLIRLKGRQFAQINNVYDDREVLK